MLEISSAMHKEAEKFAATEFGFALDAYLTDSRSLIDQLKHNITIVDKKVLDAQTILHNQFSDLKKFEIALQNRQRIEQAALDAEEVKAIDEMNVMRHANE